MSGASSSLLSSWGLAHPYPLHQGDLHCAAQVRCKACSPKDYNWLMMESALQCSCPQGQISHDAQMMGGASFAQPSHINMSPQGRGGQHTGVSSGIAPRSRCPSTSASPQLPTLEVHIQLSVHNDPKPLVAKLSGHPRARLLAFHLA